MAYAAIYRKQDMSHTVRRVQTYLVEAVTVSAALSAAAGRAVRPVGGGGGGLAVMTDTDCVWPLLPMALRAHSLQGSSVDCRCLVRMPQRRSNDSEMP